MLAGLFMNGFTALLDGLTYSDYAHVTASSSAGGHGDQSDHSWLCAHHAAHTFTDFISVDRVLMTETAIMLALCGVAPRPVY